MGIEDLEVVGEDGHEAAALGGEARQHAAEVEAQRVVLGRVDQPDAAHDHLRHRVDQVLKVRAGVRGAEELHPEVEGVDELPVVHRLDRLLLLQGDRVPQA